MKRGSIWTSILVVFVRNAYLVALVEQPMGMPQAIYEMTSSQMG